MGWDARSVILALLEKGDWHYYRLPKASHSYDGAHGWNTEWPRIRQIGEDDLLATMHGTFWRFPRDFSRGQSSGIAPRSNYLKVIGDFCSWNDRIVLGCDDSAKSEFLNTRTFKSKHAGPRQSNSNLWFIDAGQLDALGPPLGRGSVWLRDNLEAGQVSEPYLFAGYDFRQLHLHHETSDVVTFQIEVDHVGDDSWVPLVEISVPPGGAVSHIFDQRDQAAWVRLTCRQPAQGVTANFQYRCRDERPDGNAPDFDGIATVDRPAASYGLMRSLAFDKLGLAAADNPGGEDLKYYELNQNMQLVPVNDPQAAVQLVRAAHQPDSVISVDEASVIVAEDGRRYRLPKNEQYTATRSAKQQRGKSLEDYLGQNLATEANVSASSVHQQYKAAHAIDGSLDDDSRWIGRNDGQTWIQLDLGQSKSIASIWVVTGWQQSGRYAAPSFDIQIQRDGRWQTIPEGAVRDNSRVQIGIDLESPILAQQLRLVTDTDDYFRVYEIALFGQKLDIPAASGFAVPRICREVATERDLLNLHGTFYELPARNAQGLAKLRPISTHNLAIHDFCSHNGLLLLTGIDARTKSEHIFRSPDGRAAVWAGVVDDLWKLGKPRGQGGPWHRTRVRANEPSDPYLMTAYDRKRVVISSSHEATIRLEVDIDGTALWVPYRAFELAAGARIEHTFPAGFSAYWVRAISDRETTASVTFHYE
jgi:hypothetical protein